MEVMMMLVYDQPGVMQRVMGEFNRKRINVETIVVGKCEMADRARIVLSISDREKALAVIEHLKALQEVIECDLVDHSRHEAYALLCNKEGVCRLTGSVDQVDSIVKKSQPEKFIQAMNAI
ncbi:MAG: acetolactate synthase [Thermoplasmata archaeon]|jgi:acetolactate synthase-1/3 small subunit|nr:acetolactate synthase [Thermoplasmata archaeon]